MYNSDSNGAIDYYKNPDFTPVGEMLEAQNEYIREQSNNEPSFIEDDQSIKR